MTKTVERAAAADQTCGEALDAMLPDCKEVGAATTVLMVRWTPSCTGGLPTQKGLVLVYAGSSSLHCSYPGEYLEMQSLVNHWQHCVKRDKELNE